MHGCDEDTLYRPAILHGTVPQHNDIICNLANDSEIVGDQ